MKPDCAAFRSFLKDLRAQVWLTAEQRRWTHYLFHFAEIHNVISILKSNEMLCRTEAEKKAGFFHSTSSDVLDHTASRWKEHVRFYFRPRTPTFWHVEGFRSKDALNRSSLPDAHCPIPVYLLFNLEEVVCHKDSQFSPGSLARSGTSVFSKASDFSKIPFQLVYHDSAVDSSERNQVVFHRQAEVVIPARIGLENLEFICCRSQAEYETLKHLLPDEIWNHWRSKIVVQSDFNLFNRKRGYVEQVYLSRSEIRFRLHPCDAYTWEDRGPFKAKVTIHETRTSITYEWSSDDFRFAANEPLTLDISKLKYPDDYTVRFTLDGHLAYQNRYQEYDIPF